MADHKISFLDLGNSYRQLKAEIDAAILASVGSGIYIGGPAVSTFEEEFADYVEAKHCVGVGNGLDALVLALMALNIGPGDEVIVPAHTFVATWLAVTKTGATIVPVEVNVDTFCIDPLLIEAAITSKTRAIMPVHLYGHPVDLDPITEIARRHNLLVIEDAAQAHGARYKGHRIGAHSDVVAWSFYPGKNLGGLGDGGAITTNNYEVAQKIKALRNYGSSIKYKNDYLGVNSRLDPVQASVLSIKLRELDAWNAKRQEIAEIYLEGLSGIVEVELPKTRADVVHAWHLFVIRVQNRNRLQEQLLELGVETLIHYPIAPVDQECYAELAFSSESFPRTSIMAETVLSLPMDPHMGRDAAERVVAAVKRALT